MNLAGLDLNLLVALDALLAEQNVSRAAERLGLSQSATSRTLSRLRDLVGDPILVRAGQSMVTTSRANSLRAPVSQILADIRRTLELRPPFDPSSAKGTIRLSLPDMGQALLLPRLMRKVALVAPGISIDIHPRFMGLERRALEASEIDLLLSSEREVDVGFHAHYLFTLEHTCVMRPSHPLAGKRMSLKRYASQDHIVVGLQGVTATDIDAILAEKGLKRRVVLRLPSYLAVPGILERSDFITTLPSLLTQVIDRKLFTTTPPIDVPSTRISMIWHERAHYEPIQRWFRQLVVDTCTEVVGAS